MIAVIKFIGFLIAIKILSVELGIQCNLIVENILVI